MILRISASPTLEKDLETVGIVINKHWTVRELRTCSLSWCLCRRHIILFGLAKNFGKTTHETLIGA